jgi:small-conductance mechanosensitive channel
MKTFEELQSSWQQKEQKINESFLKEITTRIQNVKSKKKITMAILAITMAILFGYFLWVGIYAPPLFTVGLILMMAVLTIRIVLEWRSVNLLNRIPLDHSYYDHHQVMKVYHNSRIRIHQVITPILLIIYWIGFVMLLPTLKENLTSFWFTYVWISSIPIAIAMIVFIRYHIKKERKTLKQLEKEITRP